MDLKKITEVIKNALNVTVEDIKDISVIENGLNNKNYSFLCKGEKYVLRMPYTSIKTKNQWREEYEVLMDIKTSGIADELVYFDIDNGNKISKFISGAKSCDMRSETDIKRCINHIKKLHSHKTKISSNADIFKLLDNYESMCKIEVEQSYKKVKAKLVSLKDFANTLPKLVGLTHLDPHKDNFLLTEKEVYLIDWEFSGVFDRYADIASFITYDYLSKEKVDYIIDLYFDFKTKKEERVKVYYYIVLLSLLWYIWSLYQSQFATNLEKFNADMRKYYSEYIVCLENI